MASFVLLKKPGRMANGAKEYVRTLCPDLLGTKIWEYVKGKWMLEIDLDSFVGDSLSFEMLDK